MNESLGLGSDRRPSAFISWAHAHASWTTGQIAAWRETVLAFATKLRCPGGVDADLDLWHLTDHFKWRTYVTEAIRKSDFVLIAVSKAYRERWEGTNDPGEGAGVVVEANVLQGIFQRDQREFQRKVLLVILPGAREDDMPDELAASVEHFTVPSFDVSGMLPLLRSLFGAPEFVKPPLAPLPPFPPRFIEEVRTAPVIVDEWVTAEPRAPSSCPGGEAAALRDRLARIDATLASLAPEFVADERSGSWKPDWDALVQQRASLASSLHVLELASGEMPAATPALRWRKATGRAMGSGRVSFSPDGRHVATHLTFQVKLTDVGTGEVRSLIRRPPVELSRRSPVFSPDGRCVGAGRAAAEVGEEGAWVWDLAVAGRPLHSVPTDPDRAGVDVAVVFSRTGRYFVAPDLADMVWDTRSWAEKWDPGVPIRQPAAFGANDDWLGTAAGDEVRFSKLPGGGLMNASLHGGPGPIRSLVAHPSDGELLLAASDTHVSLHRSTGGVDLQIPLPVEWFDVEARFSSRGRYILVQTGLADERYTHIFAAGTGEALEEIPRATDCLVLPDDEGLVMFAGGMVELWSIRERRRKYRFRTADEGGIIVAKCLLDLSSDARYVATGRPKPPLGELTRPLVQVWDLMSGKQVIEPDFPAITCAFSPVELCWAAVGDKALWLYRPVTDREP